MARTSVAVSVSWGRPVTYRYVVSVHPRSSHRYVSAVRRIRHSGSVGREELWWDLQVTMFSLDLRPIF